MLYLLSETSEDSAIKIIFGVIVAVIWIIGGVMSSMKKKASQEHQAPQQDWSHLLRDLTGGQTRPYNPSTQSQVPPPLPPPPVQQQGSFVEQNPRPFVQQYQQPTRVRPLQRYTAPAQQIRTPKPIARKQKPKPQPQRRPDVATPQPLPAPYGEEDPGLATEANATIGHFAQSTNVRSSTASSRTGAPRVTRAQLSKIILWSEIIAKPLSIR